MSTVPAGNWRPWVIGAAALVFLLCAGLIVHFHYIDPNTPAGVPSHNNKTATARTVPSNSVAHTGHIKVDEGGESPKTGHRRDSESADPPDPGSDHADSTPRDTPDPAPNVLAVGRAPLNDWNTIEAEYLRRAADESLPKEVRSDAASKANFRFAEWRGRDTNRLGGYEFDPSAIAILDGWEVASSSVSIRQSDVPPVHVERIMNLQKGAASLFVRIRVAMSAGWAQQLLLEQKRSGAGGMGHTGWGDLHSIEIGDVWFGDQRIAVQGAVKEGAFDFTRRNVWIHLAFDNGSRHGEPPLPYALDLMRLGREIDSQIKEQGLQGREWVDIAGHCPRVTRFEAVSYQLAAKGGTRTPIHHRVAADANGDAIELFTASEGVVKLNVAYESPYAEVAYFDPDSVPEEPFTSRCWLVAVNTRNLLFSVAELTFTLDKP